MLRAKFCRYPYGFYSRDLNFIEEVFPFFHSSLANDNPNSSFPISLLPQQSTLISHPAFVSTIFIPSSSDDTLSSFPNDHSQVSSSSDSPQRVLTRQTKISAKFIDFHHSVITRSTSNANLSYNTSYPLHNYLT